MIDTETEEPVEIHRLMGTMEIADTDMKNTGLRADRLYFGVRTVDGN